MKRMVFLFIAVAMCARLPALYAQDASEPDEQSVLEKAREKYQDSEGREDSGETGDVEEDRGGPDSAVGRDAEPDSADRPYTPMIFSLVPGIQYPFGLYDTSFAFGLVGTAVSKLDGVQVNGVFGVAEDVDGFQVSGVFNTARDVDGFQLAGVFNTAEETDGFQVAGVFNTAGDVNGYQVAGVFNTAGKVDGGMLAGVFNAADEVDGVMIGLVNVADSVDGAVIGLINLIGDGVNEIGIHYIPDEDMVYAHYKSGTAGLYSVYYAGLGSEDWFRDWDTLIAGLGLGHRFKINNGGLDLEFCLEQELYPARRKALSEAAETEDRKAFWEELCPYPSLRASLNVPLFAGVRVFLGVEADFDVPQWGSRVPDRLRVSSFGSDGWSGEFLGLDFKAWPKLFFGVSI